jgi:hypothetical protein
MEAVKLIGIGDMSVKGYRVELCQYGNFENIGINTVADRDIDQAILTGDRDRGFRSHLGQREKPGASAAAENYS